MAAKGVPNTQHVPLTTAAAAVSPRAPTPTGTTRMASQRRQHHVEAINGHQLMSIFPPQPPPQVHPGPGPTSGYFERQERAYFARGNELESVQILLERKGGDSHLDASSRHNFHDKAGKQPWPAPPFSTTTAPTTQSATKTNGQRLFSSDEANHFDSSVVDTARKDLPTPLFYPHPGARGPANRPPPHSIIAPPHYHHHPSMGLSPTSTTTSSASSSPISPHPHFHQHSLPHALPSQEDDAWKQPIPPPERRRAGKHTKRVVVR